MQHNIFYFCTLHLIFEGMMYCWRSDLLLLLSLTLLLTGYLSFRVTFYSLPIRWSCGVTVEILGGIARTVYHTPTGCKGFFLFCRVTQIKKRNCKTQIMIKTICHTQKELTFWKDIASNIAMNWFCVCIDA